MIQVALSTGSVYTYGTGRAFELAARAGYDGVELLVDDRWDTRQAAYVRRLMAEHEIPALSVHSPFSSQSVPGWPRAEVERIKLALALTETIGAQTLNVHLPLRLRDVRLQMGARRWQLAWPGPSAEQRQYATWLLDGGLGQLQATTEVAITVENLPVRRVLGRTVNPYALNTWDQLTIFPRLCLDTTHTGTTGADLVAVYERLAERVQHIHLSNYDGRYQHQSVLHGTLPLDRFLQAVARRGFGGVVVVELTPQALPAQDEARLLEVLRQNLAFCRRHLGQEQEQEQEAAAAPATEQVAAGG